MEQCLIILLLFTGYFPPVLSVPRKYYLIQQVKNWSDAQAYCKAEYTDLAIVKNTEEMILLQNVQRQQFSSSAWIGLYNDVNSWRWSMENEPLGDETFWFLEQPNNRLGSQTCVVLTDIGWADESCTMLYHSICFDNRYTGNQRYIYNSNRMTWHSAQAYCRQYYTDLASSRDAAETAVLLGLYTGILTWIGLFRDSWKWTDHTFFSTLSWMAGKPDNVLLNEDCGFLSNGQVADTLCSDLMPFFCYRVITGQQIVRVKVQSSEDVNDPAENMIILAKINQKLKDSGMIGNFTVKWRKVPDSAVFHKIKENKTNV